MELMIVIAIIGIIAAIAIPRYQAHIRNADEKMMLVSLQERLAEMQRWQARQNTYADALNGTDTICNTVGVITNYNEAIVFSEHSINNTGTTLYQMTCKSNAKQFSIEVNALDRQLKQPCTFLVVNQDGIVKSTSTDSPKSNNAACDTLLK